MAGFYRVPDSSQTYLKFPLTPSLSPVGTVSQCHSEALAEESLFSNLLIL